MKILFEIIVSMASIAGFGAVADHFADTTPIFTLVGAALGAIVSVVMIKLNK